MEANEPTISADHGMTAIQASRLCIFAGIRHGVGICCSVCQDLEDPERFGADMHLRGHNEHVKVWKYSRGAIDAAADSLWLFAFPEIPA